MKKSFTLIELLIVVAILGLLAAIAVPAFVRAREQAKKDQAGRRQVEATVEKIEVSAEKVVIPGYKDLGAFTYRGCTYLIDYEGHLIHHAGCTNPNHSKN